MFVWDIVVGCGILRFAIPVEYETKKLCLTSECLASLGPPRVTGEPRSQGEQW